MSEEVLVREMPLEVPVDQHVSIRLFVPEDAQRIYDMVTDDPDILTHIGWLDECKTVEDIAERISLVNQADSYRYGIIEDGKVVGYVGLWPSHKSPEPYEFDIGYFLDPKARGRGLVTKSVNALIDAAGKNISVDSFALFIREANLESQAVAKRLGFAATDFMFKDPQGLQQRRYVRARNDQAAAS